MFPANLRWFYFILCFGWIITTSQKGTHIVRRLGRFAKVKGSIVEILLSYRDLKRKKYSTSIRGSIISHNL